MTTFSTQFEPFAERMQAEGLPDIFIRTFAYYYEQLVAGHTGLIPRSEIEPVGMLPDAETLSGQLAEVGQEVLAKTAVIKLNGGLGTGMGLAQAKSLLPVKEGLSFLDVIARQTLNADIPLLLMNSFVTDADSLAALRPYPELDRGLPLSFVQHKAPKIVQSDLSPATWPAEPELEWCPPGHGDIYTALITSRALEKLLQAGYQYAFVSNADNLGAVIDMAILGYFAQKQFPFLMEVADRTEMDKKGGHLARRGDGQLILRELAQCPAADTAVFQDVTHHKFFNTNNLWLNLPILQQVMTERNNTLGLAMIRNAKTVDPRDGRSTPVYQLETAMGSAIGVFEGAQAIRVPRARFAPVKRTNELLAVRSDAFTLTEDFRVVPSNGRQFAQLTVELDDRYYKFITDLDDRFPHDAPSLIACRQLSVRGDFKFGRNVTCKGDVQLINKSEQQIIIPDGAVLEGRQEVTGK